MKNKVLLLGSSGLVGRAMKEALRDAYQVIPAAGHQVPEGGYCLPVEEPERLVNALDRENPEVVISSIRGNYPAQMVFHGRLADWLAGKEKRLLYVSTANVFDGDLSRPWTEADPPEPESEYGIFKRDCEAMLEEKLGKEACCNRTPPGTVIAASRQRPVRRSKDRLAGSTPLTGRQPESWKYQSTRLDARRTFCSVAPQLFLRRRVRKSLAEVMPQALPRRESRTYGPGVLLPTFPTREK